MAFSNRELFARLIKCEAGGEGLDGMKAVATVIMNRVHVAYGEYLREGQGDLRRVIEQPYQFTCLMPEVYGEVNPQTVWSSPPEQIHYDVVDWALAGNTHWGAAESLCYFNRVNQHCFYLPTPLYAET